MALPGASGMAPRLRLRRMWPKHSMNSDMMKTTSYGLASILGLCGNGLCGGFRRPDDAQRGPEGVFDAQDDPEAG